MENLFAHGKIRTRSGRHLDAFTTNPDDIVIEDIAHALSRITRAPEFRKVRDQFLERYYQLV